MIYGKQKHKDQSCMFKLVWVQTKVCRHRGQLMLFLCQWLRQWRWNVCLHLRV